jgi:hypothetical protein
MYESPRVNIEVKLLLDVELTPERKQARRERRSLMSSSMALRCCFSNETVLPVYIVHIYIYV